MPGPDPKCGTGPALPPARLQVQELLDGPIESCGCPVDGLDRAAQDPAELPPAPCQVGKVPLVDRLGRVGGGRAAVHERSLDGGGLLERKAHLGVGLAQRRGHRSTFGVRLDGQQRRPPETPQGPGDRRPDLHRVVVRGHQRRSEVAVVVHPGREQGKPDAPEPLAVRHRQEEQEAIRGVGQEQVTGVAILEVAGGRQDHLLGEERVGLERVPLQLRPPGKEPPVTAGDRDRDEPDLDQLYPQRRRWPLSDRSSNSTAAGPSSCRNASPRSAANRVPDRPRRKLRSSSSSM